MPLNPFEKEHVRDILFRNQQISRLIDGAMNDIARRFTTVKGKRFASIMKERLADLQEQILNNGKDGIRSQWLLSNRKNNKEIDGYLQSNLVTEDMYKSFRSPNLTALNAFLDRTRNGKTLNGRVWNITRTAGKEINDLIGQGVLEGKSAIQTARDLKKYAKGKPILYKGKLIKGSNINFQAIRLAATEMNLAFRTSDYLQNSRLPFVTGVTVHLSPAHPRQDICDEMEGGYPKGFHFSGWHPLCICYATYDRISPKKFVDYIKTGKIDKRRFTRAIPQRAQRYVKKNGKRFQGYKSVPYWLDDNFTQDLKLRSFVKTDLMDKPISMSKPNPVKG